jgi:hypothetical protein
MRLGGWIMKKILIFSIIALIIAVIAWVSIGDSGLAIFIKPM